MSDIFAPLREPESSSPLAPDEVRRRGDSLRRRRVEWAVAAAAATAAVVTASFLLISDPRARPSPGPIEPPSRQAIIPEDFDLADGLPRGVIDTVAAHPTLVVCGEDFSLSDRALASQGITSNKMGDLTIRGLSVYPEAATAQLVASELVAKYEDCQRPLGPGGPRSASQVGLTSFGDQGWMVTTVKQPRAGVRFPEVTHVVRVDASLLITQQREIHGISTKALIRGTSDQVTRLMDRQMCLLTEQGCA